MNETITHKHLKRQFDNFENADDLKYLFAELQFSTLLLPVESGSDKLAFPIIQFDDKRIVPVFTDVHEFNKCGFDDNLTLTSYDFDFYCGILDEDIDGIIIDIAGEAFPLTSEIIEFIRPHTIKDIEARNLTLDEIRSLKDNIDNSELEDFLADESNRWNFEQLLNLLQKSHLFEVILSFDDLSDKSDDGIISLHDVGRLPSAMTAKGTERYALLYTSQREVIPKANPMHPYLQVANLSDLVRNVLRQDLDGIVLNENTQDIVIPRQFLLDHLTDFQNVDRYDDYAFPLNS